MGATVAGVVVVVGGGHFSHDAVSVPQSRCAPHCGRQACSGAGAWLRRVRLGILCAMAMSAVNISKTQTKMAKEALARWRRDGILLDENNTGHVDAYLVVKQRTTARRVRPAAVLEVLASTADVSESFAQLSTEFIVTQKSQFPNGVPKAMIQFLVTADEIALNYKQVNDLDLEDV